MAGGQLSARQKMINLMYLIFIAMLALNMSKEVLSAFGLMNEKLVESNQAATSRNTDFFAGLEQQASEQPDKFQPLLNQANQVQSLANDLNSYIADLKGQMTSTLDDPTDYEIMDKGDFLDNRFFIGDKLKPEGQEFLDKLETFRNGINDVIGETYPAIAADVDSKFATEPVTNGDGNVLKWLDYHYKGFPLVASLTKMTQLQADIKTTESEVMSTMLKGKMLIEASLTNFEAIVVPDKSAFFNGENFTGKIILGRKDKTLKAHKVIVNGKELSADAMQEGQTLLSFPAGSVGENKIQGEFQFMEGGKMIPIEINDTYAVVPKPNSATISADKMNVVYRGVKNPMTISFAGVSDNNVQANAEGLTKISGVGKYVMDATRVKGREVTINVSGTLPDGDKVSDRATFRIKDLPRPTGTVRGEDGNIKMQRNALDISTIGAKFEDFDFNLPLTVTGFKFKVLGQPTINVNGSKLDTRAKAALSKAKRGSDVQIFDIEAKAQGVSVILKKVSSVIIELTN
ncbi:MAG: gliding motility-associated protein GldM [Glaciecola sp.]|jgi:gliding motility-associated protein GldM